MGKDETRKASTNRDDANLSAGGIGWLRIQCGGSAIATNVDVAEVPHSIYCIAIDSQMEFQLA